MPVFDPGVPWLRGTATLTNGSTTVTTDGVITLNEILEGDRLYARASGGAVLGPFEIVGGENDEIELREAFEGATGSYAIAIDRNPITRTGARVLRDMSVILRNFEDQGPLIEEVEHARDEAVTASLTTGYVFQTQSEVEARPVPSLMATIRRGGYTLPGDPGGAQLVETTSSNPYGTPSGDGRWWLPADLTITPQMFGATGSSPQELELVQKALNFCAEYGRTLRISREHVLNGTLQIPSGTRVVSDAGGKFTEATIRLEGTVGASAAITAPVPAGATVVDVADSLLFNPGDYVRLVSCINAQSADAGEFILGDRASGGTYLAEFAKVYKVEPGKIMLDRSVIFPYATTPGPDSMGRTQSEVYKVSLADDIRIEGLKVERSDLTVDEPPLMAIFAGPEVAFRDCTFDCSQATYEYARAASLFHCFGTRLIDSTFRSVAFDAMGGSEGNTRVMGCQEVLLRDCVQDGGNQGIDISIGGYQGVVPGPSIHTKVYNCTFQNTRTDAITTHWGCWQNHIKDCNVVSKAGSGIRVRSRGDIVEGNNVAGQPGTGWGIYLTGIPWWDVKIFNNDVTGFMRGVGFDFILQGDLTRAAIPTSLLGMQITDNRISRSSDGVYLAALMSGDPVLAVVENNTIHKVIGNGVYINSYVNASLVTRNKFRSCAAGIRIQKNSVDGLLLYNDFVDCPIMIRGASGSGSQVEDTATFGVRDNAGYVIRDNAGRASGGNVSLPSGLVSNTPLASLGDQPFVTPLGRVAPTVANGHLAFWHDVDAGVVRLIMRTASGSSRLLTTWTVS